jgi:NAD(P)-dependent dehydrogenase (short-subunit alcohol dehydrogenase family)
VDALAKLLPLSLREAMLGSAAGPSVSGADGEEVDAAAGAGAASSALSSSGGAGKAGAGGPPPSKRPRREGVAASSSGSASAAPSLSGVHRLLGEVAGEVPESVCRFIINVSAMEGKFNRSKTPNHPQTNMAKAALNMMTRTSAQDYAEDLILMNCVDT